MWLKKPAKKSKSLMKYAEKYLDATVQKTKAQASAACTRPAFAGHPFAHNRSLIMKFFSLLILFFSLTAYADQAAEKSAVLEPSHAQQITTLEIVRKLQIQHFEKHTIDDNFSLSFLDNYLKALDPNRQIFQQAEINALYKKYGTQLDDTIKRGNVKPGFEIFNQYQKRHTALLEKTLANLAATVKAFDYNKDERVETDRSKAPWPKDNKAIDT